MNAKTKFLFIVAKIVFVLSLAPLSGHAETIQGITTPSADITMSFVTAGRIKEPLVEVGTQVEPDQKLANLDDESEKIQCQQLKLLSEDRTKVDAAGAELAQRRVDLRKVQVAQAKGAASNWEVDHLKLDVRLAELALESAILEQEQYRRRYAHARSQLTRMHLTAPIAGFVESVNVEVGESIGTLEPVVRIVQNDPLWIDLPVPMAKAMKLKLYQDVRVLFSGQVTDNTSNQGQIITISTVADAASDTLGVRIAVPNPMKRPAGERVEVSFYPEEDLKKQAKLQLD